MDPTNPQKSKTWSDGYICYGILVRDGPPVYGKRGSRAFSLHKILKTLLVESIHLWAILDMGITTVEPEFTKPKSKVTYLLM